MTNKLLIEALADTTEILRGIGTSVRAGLIGDTRNLDKRIADNEQLLDACNDRCAVLTYSEQAYNKPAINTTVWLQGVDPIDYFTRLQTDCPIDPDKPVTRSLVYVQSISRAQFDAAQTSDMNSSSLFSGFYLVTAEEYADPDFFDEEDFDEEE